MSFSSRLVDKAIQYATKAHEGQVRKYTGEPYISHPMGVANIVSRIRECSDEMIAAAVLHDVVEDTIVNITDIRREFGDTVAGLVDQVTDVSTKEDGNRATRKKKDLEHLSKSCPVGATIKLADLIHNTCSVCKHDKGFAKVYLKEKRELLRVLRHGDSMLWTIANTMVHELSKETSNDTKHNS